MGSIWSLEMPAVTEYGLRGTDAVVRGDRDLRLYRVTRLSPP